MSIGYIDFSDKDLFQNSGKVFLIEGKYYYSHYGLHEFTPTNTGYVCTEENEADIFDHLDDAKENRWQHLKDTYGDDMTGSEQGFASVVWADGFINGYEQPDSITYVLKHFNEEL